MFPQASWSVCLESDNYTWDFVLGAHFTSLFFLAVAESTKLNFRYSNLHASSTDSAPGFRTSKQWGANTALQSPSKGPNVVAADSLMLLSFVKILHTAWHCEAFVYVRRGFVSLQLLVDRYIIGWPRDIELTNDTCKAVKLHYWVDAILVLSSSHPTQHTLHKPKETCHELLLASGLTWAMNESLETQATITEHLRHSER